MSTKAFLFLLLVGLAAARIDESELPPPLYLTRKIHVGNPMDLNVGQAAAIAVPLNFVAGDYQGPYDPMDPKGVGAATRRRASMEHRAGMEELKTYIPPDAAKFLRKEVIKVLLNEGRRFTVAHPKEAAEILGIVRRVATLINTTTHKVKQIQKKKKVVVAVAKA